MPVNTIKQCCQIQSNHIDKSNNYNSYNYAPVHQFQAQRPCHRHHIFWHPQSAMLHIRNLKGNKKIEASNILNQNLKLYSDTIKEQNYAQNGISSR